MLSVGSPEWFHEKSKTIDMERLNQNIEKMRETFLDRFSPDKLSAMSGSELLQTVFSDNPDSMMRILMKNVDYRWFGAPGPYKHLGVIYQDGLSTWKFMQNTKPELLSSEKAIEKAEFVRDLLLHCVSEIEYSGVFSSIRDYLDLQSRIECVFFYKYTWAMKYYQMLFPQYFPGMYSDKTIERALSILGLPKHGTQNRLINAGELSLFIRKCDINNIIFSTIYENEWGWDKPLPPCENASENYNTSSIPTHTVNLNYYNTSYESRKKTEGRNHSNKIETDFSSVNLNGYEKEAIVKARVNQGVFRKLLLRRYGSCCLCGVHTADLLIASHIKPWTNSMPHEKLDSNNGLLLCPNHDKLFDLGLISFDNTGHILISSRLSKDDRERLNICDDMVISISEQHLPYLEYHRNNVYKA